MRETKLETKKNWQNEQNSRITTFPARCSGGVCASAHGLASWEWFTVKHTHKRVHYFAAQISKNWFFSMTQFLFSCKRRKNNTPRENPPLPLLDGVTERCVTGVQIGSGMRTTWASPEEIVWWAVAAGWGGGTDSRISMHAYAGVLVSDI